MNVGAHPGYALSLFSGVGALDLAVKRVFPGSRVVSLVEREAYACAVLAARMEEGALDPAPVWSDIATFDAADLARRLAAATGRGIDLVYGGFPCQDLSLAGKRAGLDGERSGLFFELVRVVRDVRPRYVLLENVAAIASGRALDAVLGALAEIGLDAEWGCLRASDVGAPHRRDRWWCLAWDPDQLAHPARLQREGQGRGLWDGGRIREVREALADAADGGWRAGLADADAGRGQPDDARGRLALGDAAGVGRREGRAAPAVRGGGHAAAGPGGVAVGDAGQRALARGPSEQGREPVGRAAAARPGEPVGTGAWPGFPPGPDDRDGWRAFLDARPDLAPAIERAVRGGADGAGADLDVCLCPRVDQLRGLGNAVVPDQAEAAIRLLWYRAFGEWP